MPNNTYITYTEIEKAATHVALQMTRFFSSLKNTARPLLCYPVPRGGIPAFYAVQQAFNRLPISARDGASLLPVNDPAMARVAIDDLVDSGSTRDNLLLANPHLEFIPLFTKGVEYRMDEWLVFPWEGDAVGSQEDIFTRLIQTTGDDVRRSGLADTPKRCVKAWAEWTSGYHVDPVSLLRTFEDGAEQYDEMIHITGIPFYSQCEHHLAPFFGTVDFAYIPDKCIVGLSKLPRLVEVFARRLQVQERLTTQVITTFCEAIQPRGAGITIRARHLCMESRGINKPGSVTTTNKFIGVLKEDTRARMEYLSITK
jgi:GTP cyclohydrolase IA